jgi:hypothetical protein
MYANTLCHMINIILPYLKILNNLISYIFKNKMLNHKIKVKISWILSLNYSEMGKKVLYIVLHDLSINVMNGLKKEIVEKHYMK